MPLPANAVISVIAVTDLPFQEVIPSRDRAHIVTDSFIWKPSRASGCEILYSTSRDLTGLTGTVIFINAGGRKANHTPAAKGEKLMAYMAIETKYLGPTNYRGSRIKATPLDTFTEGRRISATVAYDYSGDAEANHRAAAELLLPQVVRDWPSVDLVAGATATGYVFVAVQKKEVSI